MQIPFLALSQAANLDKGNQFNLLGVLRELRPAKYPTKVPPFVVCADVVFGAGDEGELPLTLHFEDAEGNSLHDITFKVDRSRDAASATSAKVILRTKGVVLQKPGSYAVAIYDASGACLSRAPVDMRAPAEEGGEGRDASSSSASGREPDKPSHPPVIFPNHHAQA